MHHRPAGPAGNVTSPERRMPEGPFTEMRIRHLVCTDNFAGVERYVATTSVELARRGHHVEIYGGAPAAMRTALGDATVEFIEAPDARAALVAQRGRPRPHLVHAHMTAADVVAIATRPLVRAPVVSTLHFAQPRGHDRSTRTVYRVIPRLVTAEVAISRAVNDANGGGAEVILEGIPDPGPAKHGERQPVVLLVQRLEPEKDTATALRAFAVAGVAHDGWRLEIAGRGADRDALSRLAEALGIARSIEFLGHVDDVETLLEAASLFLATTPDEGFGLSVVEAMAHGLPVIATDGGAHPETIGTATPETLFAAGEAEAAAALLHRYAHDVDARADLAGRVRARYEEAFTIERHVDALEDLYDRVVARRRR